MLKFLCDENFNGDVLRGLLLRLETLDAVRVQDVQLCGLDDASVLEWASANERLVLAHDRATFPAHAFHRVTAKLPMPGVIVINDRLPTSLVIGELLVLAECGVPADFESRVLYLPL
jgi:predicted nuclease of predicted toxin-antitoxin system